MSQSQGHRIVIGAKAYSSDGMGLLRELVRAIGQKFSVETISSIYRVHGQKQRPEHIHDLRSFAIFEALTTTLIATTNLSPSEVLTQLKAVEGALRSEVMRRSVSLNLFFYDDLAIMTPELTLPYGEFHLYPENVLPTAEVCPDWRHPVLRKSVRELAHSFSGTDWGEFFSQGKSALDFYPPQD